jgi:nucleotide-binding universal stress UspA family protein
MYEIDRVIAAIDFSAPGASALDRAIELAEHFAAELHIAHAFASPMVLYGPYEGSLPQPFVDDARRAAADKLEEARSKAEANGVSACTHLLNQPVAKTVAELARELRADCIVVGTHGHTGLKHALLGSVAENIIRHAPCDVWVVRGRAGSPGAGQ